MDTKYVRVVRRVKESKEKRGYYLKKYLNKELSYRSIRLFTSI